MSSRANTAVSHGVLPAFLGTDAIVRQRCWRGPWLNDKDTSKNTPKSSKCWVTCGLHGITWNNRTCWVSYRCQASGGSTLGLSSYPRMGCNSCQIASSKSKCSAPRIMKCIIMINRWPLRYLHVFNCIYMYLCVFKYYDVIMHDASYALH